jgi:putative tricarboxylic transport membrane protein
MDVMSGLSQGFAALFSPSSLAACIIGMMIGLASAFIPGISPAGAVVLALPVILGLGLDVLGSNGAAIFLVAVAYGALYGRTLAAINLRGAAATSAGPHVAASDRSILVGGLVAGLAVAVLAAAAAMYAKDTILLYFGPSEFAAVTIFVFLVGIACASGSAVGALAAVVLGLLLATIGNDIETDTPRLTFGIPGMGDGIGRIQVAIGLFVIATVIRSLERNAVFGPPVAAAPDSAASGSLRRAMLGVLTGLLPSGSAAVTAAEQEQGPDSARIVGAGTASDIVLSASFVPLLVFGFPIGVLAALLATVITGVQTITDRTAAAWMVFAALIALHVAALIVVTLGGFARWRPIRIDARIVAPLIIACCCLSAYSLNESVIDVGLALVFGVLGYAMIVGEFDRGLFFLAFVLGPALEENIRRSFMIARGDMSLTAQRPIVAGFLIAGALLIVVVRAWRHRRSLAAARAAPA